MTRDDANTVHNLMRQYSIADILDTMTTACGWTAHKATIHPTPDDRIAERDWLWAQEQLSATADLFRPFSRLAE